MAGDRRLGCQDPEIWAKGRKQGTAQTWTRTALLEAFVLSEQPGRVVRDVWTWVSSDRSSRGWRLC